MKLRYWLILFFIISTRFDMVYCQCRGYEDWTVFKQVSIMNEPEYRFGDVINISQLKDGQLLLKIDTTFSWKDSANSIILSNKRYSSIDRDSFGFVRNFTKNRDSDELLHYMGCGKEIYSIDLVNCYIRFFISPLNKWRISIFEYNLSKVYFYESTSTKPIG